MKKLGLLIAGILFASQAYGYIGFIENINKTYPHIKDTKLNDCLFCHTKDKWLRNDYGLDLNAWLKANIDIIEAQGYDAWLQAGIAAIEKKDSDGDGVINLQEISDVTFPGDKDDHARICEPRP